MVEIREIAVIFKRIKKENELKEEFIPIKVVEGYFDEKSGLFIDKQENTYSHLAEHILVGNSYAFRENIGDIVGKYPNLSLKEIKQKKLEYFKKKRYIRDLNEDLFPYIENTNGVRSILKDMDSDEIYESYKEYSILGENLKEMEEEFEDMEIDLDFSLEDVVNELKKTFKGQDDAINKIVTNIWLYRKYPEYARKNMLLVGPIGSGKRAILKKTAEILGVPLITYAMPSLMQASNLDELEDEILVKLLLASNQNIKAAENGIVILEKMDNLSLDVYGSETLLKTIQDELGKTLRGEKKIINMSDGTSIDLDTSKILFAGCGEFREINNNRSKRISCFDTREEDTSSKKINHDSLSKYGISDEILGMMPIIIELNKLTSDNLKDILINSDESELWKNVNILSSMGVTITNLEEVIDMIVNSAIKKNIGAKGLISVVNGIFLNIIYDVCSANGKYSEVILGNNIINDDKDYQLISKKCMVRKRIK